MQDTESIINESGLESVDKDDVYGDIVYIENKKLVKSMHPIGMSYPATLMINVNGIDAVDAIMEQSLEALRKENDKDTKRNVEDILSEVNPSSKTRKFFKYFKERPELFVSIGDKVIASVLANIPRSS